MNRVNIYTYCSVVNRPNIKGGSLSYVNIAVVHAANYIAKGIGHGSLKTENISEGR